MAKFRALALGLLVFAGCARLGGCSSFTGKDGWNVEHVEERWNSTEPQEDSVRFANGVVWENVGMKVEKIAAISGPGNSRGIAFRALSCVECEADLLLTFRSSGSDKVIPEPYPGKMTELDARTGVAELTPYAEVRAFYGKCIPGQSTELFIVDSHSMKEASALRKKISLSETGFETSREKITPKEFLDFRPPPGCREIPGKNRDVEV